MVRIKRGVSGHKKHKKILQSAKGYKGAHSKLFRTAKQQVMKGLRYSYIHRKTRKAAFRSNWIIQINAMANKGNTNYSQLMSKLKRLNIGLNRKMLAQLANFDTESFTMLLNL